MNDLRQRVLRSIRAHDLIPPGDSALVAVSGGVDSMVLLRVLHKLAKPNGWKLVVAHYNHMLRGKASKADADLVRGTAEGLGLEFVYGEGDVKGFAQRHRLSIEMAARQLRHQFLCESARTRRIGRIALAHHADDQVELFFLRLLRGTGTDGLSGMRWTSPSPFDCNVMLCRPLLDITKQSLVSYARRTAIIYREDRSNRSNDILRNRVRHKLLPLLREQFQPALDAVILRLMAIIQSESDLLKDLATGKAEAPWTRFEDAPVALQRRRLQRELERVGILAVFETIEFLRLNPGRGMCISPGKQGRAAGKHSEPGLEQCEILRNKGGRVCLRFKPQTGSQFCGREIRLDKPTGVRRFDCVRLRWKTTKWTGGFPLKMPGIEVFDADKVEREVVVRHWRTGDRFRPIGMENAVKLQDFFTNEKIPRHRRHQLLVATTARGEIFWVEGLRIGERFKVTRRTTRSLHWQWERL